MLCTVPVHATLRGSCLPFRIASNGLQRPIDGARPGKYHGRNRKRPFPPPGSRLSRLNVLALCGSPVAMSSRSASALQAAPVVFSKFVLGWLALVWGFSFGLDSSHAAAPDKPERRPMRRATKRKIPPPEEIDLATDDGLQMKATLLSGHQGPGEHSRGPVATGSAARTARPQPQGLHPGTGVGSVLAGEARLRRRRARPPRPRREHPDQEEGSKRTEDLKGKKMQPAQISAMVTDLRAVKDFLWKKNKRQGPEPRQAGGRRRGGGRGIGAEPCRR